MAVAPRRRRRRPYGTIAVLVVLLGGLGYTLEPRLRGEPIRDPFGLFGAADAGGGGEGPLAPPPDGYVRVLTSARNIPAYAKVRNDDVFDAQRKRISSIDIPEGLAEKNGILTDASMIFGRVLAKAKRPGFAFTEEDFLPEGTRPGLAGGVPPGKRGYRVEVDLVHGIIGLNPGDRFDLITSRTVEDVPRKENTPAFVGVYAEMMGQRAKSSRGVDRAQVDVIV